MKDSIVSSPEQPPKKKSKPIDSQLPPSKFLTFPFAKIKPMSFAYPSDFPDPSTEDQLTITKMFVGSKTPSPAIIDLSVSTLLDFTLTLHNLLIDHCLILALVCRKKLLVLCGRINPRRAGHPHSQLTQNSSFLMQFIGGGFFCPSNQFGETVGVEFCKGQGNP